MAVHYQKTDAGREEIRARKLELSRPARTLLLIIDGTKSGDEWLAMVNGVGAPDLAALVAAGLIAPTASSAPAPRAASSSARAAAPAPSVPAHTGPGLEEALQAMSYRELYDRLTAEARSRLGLIKGYRLVLEIEKCSGPDEIRQLALRFAEEVRTTQGEEVARGFRLSLGAGG